jgi:hypothetical protein
MRKPGSGLASGAGSSAKISKYVTESGIRHFFKVCL